MENKQERRTQTINGKTYPIVKCEICQVWIQEKDFEKHKNSENCKKWEKQDLGKINKELNEVFNRVLNDL